MSYNNIILTTKDFVSTITLNRPPTNSVNLGIREELDRAITELEKSKETRVVIISCWRRLKGRSGDISTPKVEKAW